MKRIKIRGSDFSLLCVLLMFIFYFNFIVENQSFFASKKSEVKIEMSNTKSVFLTGLVIENIDLLNFNLKKRNCPPKQFRG